MTPPRSQGAEATLAGFDPVAARAPLIPSYLEQVYWWAYVHPNAVAVFEREWLVSAILFGRYGLLRDAALAELGDSVQGSTLQVACVYGNLTPQGDSSSLACPDARYDQVLLFFLLHEQPEAVRRGTLAEALRVVKPGGKVVIVDYHRPARWHVMRPLMRLVFRKLEPYAMDLWNHEIQDFIPQGLQPTSMAKRTYFGGLYQKLVLTR
jgi:SAM-dependent methyltransferase